MTKEQIELVKRARFILKKSKQLQVEIDLLNEEYKKIATELFNSIGNEDILKKELK